MKKLFIALLVFLLSFVLFSCKDNVEKSTVFFDTNCGETIADLIVEKGNSISAPQEPTQSSYTFLGWFSDKELTTEVIFPFTVTADIVLYAKWAKTELPPAPPPQKSEIVLSFNIDGIVVKQQTIPFGTSISDFPTLKKSGFEGKWFLDEDGTVPYTDSAIFTDDTSIYGIFLPYFIRNGGIITGLTLLGKRCDNLIIPETINAEAITEIADNALSGAQCRTLSLPSSINTINPNSFLGCSLLQNYLCSGDFFKAVDGILFSADETTLYSFPYAKERIELSLPEGLTIVYANAFNGRRGIDTLVLPSTITAIGSSAMKDFTAEITCLGFPVLPAYAFSNYQGTSITLQEGLNKIEERAFLGCSKLLSLTLPSTLKDIGVYAFDSLSIPVLFSANSEMTELSDYSFCKYNGTAIALPDGLTKIGAYAFSGCVSLKNLTFPSSVKHISEYALKYCYKLEKVVMDNSVENIGEGLFYDCWKLKDLTFSSKITVIPAAAFYSCKSLTKSPVGNNITSIGSLSFKDCSQITAFDFSAVCINISELAFVGCCGIKTLTVNEANPSFYSDGKVLYNKDKTLLIFGQTSGEATIPSSVTTISSYAFYKSKITKLTFSSGLTSINDYAFFGADLLTEIVFPSSLTSIGEYAFSECSSIWTITIDEACLAVGSYAFSKCTSLRTVIVLPAGNPPYIGVAAFEQNHEDRKFYIPTGTIERYKLMWSGYGDTFLEKD